MVHLSRRAGGLKGSVTLAIDAKAKQLAAAGEKVIRFGVGEPDFDTPEHVKQAVRRALDGRIPGYTPVPGTPAMREAAARAFRRCGIDTDPAQVIVSCGAKHSLFNAISVLVDDGDEVVVPAPYWVSYPSMAEANGAKAVYIDTRPDHCVLTPERLAAALTPRTRVLLLNSPNNPTGVTMTRDQLAALGPVLEKYPQVVVISDEIYLHLVYGDTEFTPFVVACPQLADRTISVHGVSKSFAMTGWRIGYATGPEAVVKAMTRYQSHTTSNPTSIAQIAAIAALDGPMEPIEAMRKAFDRRRKLMSGLLQAIPGMTLVPPTGAFYCFPDLGACLNDRTGRTPLEFCDRLLDECHVATVPGEAFGAPTNFRLSYACSEADIEEGCARIRAFLGA